MAGSLASNIISERPSSGDMRRQWQRISTIRRMARISDGFVQGLVRINNISDGGLCLTVPGKLIRNSAVTIHLADDVSLTGTVAWSKGGECGVRLDEVIDCRSVLSAATRSICRSKGRGLTLQVDEPIQVVVHGEPFAGRLREVTPHSCKMTGLPTLQRGSPLKLLFGPAVVRRAFVCDVEQDCASILFCEALEISDLGLCRQI